MVKEPVCLLGMSDKHEKIFVGDTYMFYGDVLQLLNINYELKYWDDINFTPY